MPDSNTQSPQIDGMTIAEFMRITRTTTGREASPRRLTDAARAKVRLQNQLRRKAGQTREWASVIGSSGTILALTLWGADLPLWWSFIAAYVGLMGWLMLSLLAYSMEKRLKNYVRK